MSVQNVYLGLYRLFTVFSIAVVLFYGFIAWDTARPPYQCAIFKDEEGGAWWTEPERIFPDGSVLPEMKRYRFDRSVCPQSEMQAIAKQAGQAVLWAFISEICMLVIWMAFRWVFIGFFPAAVASKS